MNIIPIKTHKITSSDKNILNILDRYLPKLNEKTILAVTSKIVSITEGRTLEIGSIDKKKLIQKEADWYIDEETQYGHTLTIKDYILLPSAGIDESNGKGRYILWPKNPQKSANLIRSYLKRKFRLKDIGIIITDSKTTPLRWGVTGVCVAYSGFFALNDFIGRPDLFGYILKATKVNMVDALATAAVVVMGESVEQTPLGIISDVPFVRFNKNDPTKKEIDAYHIEMKDDLFAPILTKTNWKRSH